MSKSSTATAKIPQKSAWSRGPPTVSSSSASSSRPQSPAPSSAQPANASHSRRPSALGGHAVPIQDGVSIPRGNVGSAGRSSHVSFGSIDDSNAQISSSPTSTPAIKASIVKSFGTVPATNGRPASSTTSASSTSTSTNSKDAPAASAPAKPKFDVKSLFQNPSSAGSSQPSSDTSSPSVRPSNLPPSQPSSSASIAPASQPPNAGSYSSFTPHNGIRNQHQQQGAGQGQRSPAFQRNQPPNGTNNGPRPPPSAGANGPGGPTPMSPGLPSNRPPANPTPPAGMQPQMMQWGHPQYYYPMGPGPEGYMYPPPPTGWYMPQPGQHPQQHSGHMQPPMPMSPRNPPIQHPSPTPAPAAAVPSTPHPPPATAGPAPPLAHHHSASNSVSSPPPTPSSARLSTAALPFVPGQRKVTLTTPDGKPIQPSAVVRGNAASAVGGGPVPGPTPPASASPKRRSAIPIVSPEEKRRIEEKAKAEQDAKAEKERKEREEKERKQKEDRDRKEREEKERVEREEKEKLKKEEAAAKEKLRKEEEERVRERKRKEEEEAKAKAASEAAEAERKRKEDEAKSKAEAEAAAKKAEEEAAAKKKEEEEAAKKAAEEETKKKEEEEAKAKKDEEVKETTKTDEEVEEGEIQEEKEKKPPLKLDPPQKSPDFARRRPGPLDLSTTRRDIPQPLPSALATARHIEDINSVQYPEGIKSPRIELNQNVKDGKFRYDRDFLLQFMNICKDKPDQLPPLDVFGLEPDNHIPMSRGGSGRHRTTSASVSNRQSSLGMGFNAAGLKDRSASGFSMGNFAVGAKLSSDERFQLANSGRTMSGSGSSLSGFRPPSTMQRTTSQGGPGSGSSRTRSKRGTQRSEANKVQAAHQQHGHGGYNNPNNALNLEPVAPLQASENRWDRRALQQLDVNSPEVVERKVKGLLNKLTMEKFDSISDQIVAWANKSENETDGRTLIQVIRLVFEKATDEATWSEMYARLCRKMMEMISPKVQDDGIRNSDGKPIAGGQLFRKYLLNRCQEDFERGWAAKEATNAAAKTKAKEDEAVKAANEEQKESGKGDEEIALYSDEYYAAQKAKRQGLGLIKFIGELFKLQMLTERIMHECVKKLLGNVENPEEEEIESLCKLLITVGAILDTPKAKAHMDVYFSRMKELTRSANVSSRMQFMLQDVLELRDRKWISRNAVAAPTTIAAVHEAAAKEKAAQDKDSYNRTISMSRGGSRRGADRGEQQPGPDGWAPVSRAPLKAGDLSKFGQMGNRPSALGPGGVFGLKDKKNEKRESASMSRASSNSNMFSMLSQGGDPTPENTSSKGSRPPSRKPSVDLGSGSAPEAAPQRRKLALLPRTKPVEPTENATDSPARTESPIEEPEMLEADAKKKIDEDLKEFFAVRNIDEGEDYFIKLPAKFHSVLVDKLVSQALESKEADAQLVSDLFKRAAEKELATPEDFETGFNGTAEFLDDIAIDAPKAPALMAIMMEGPGFSEEQRSRIASKSPENGDKLFSS